MKKLYRTSLQAAALAALVLTILLLLGRFHWFLQLLTHFRLPCAIGFILLALLLLPIKSFKSAALVAVCLVFQLIPLSRHYLPFGKDNNTGFGPELKVITFNVLTINQEHSEVLRLIRKEQPDLVCLQETSQDWIDSLQPLRDDYPFTKEHPKDNNTGLLLLSKLPIQECKVVTNSLIGNPYMTATLDWNGQALTLINAHPYPPMNSLLSKQLQATFRKINQDATNKTTPLIVVGDFNCSAYAPDFKLLGNELRDSSRGRGYPVTWQRGHPLLGIPIDQLLYSRDLVCSSRKIGPKQGSDHSPIIATLQARSQQE